MKTVSILLLILSSVTTFALEKSSWKLGVGPTGDSTNWGLAFDLASPNLFSFTPAGSKLRTGFALLAKGDVRFLNNRTVYNGAVPSLSLGIRGTRYTPDSNMAFYAVIAADLAWVSSTASSQPTNLGLLLTWGGEFLIEKDHNDLIFGVNDMTFFVEGNLMLHTTLNLLPANPDLLSGFMPRIGIRSHF